MTNQEQEDAALKAYEAIEEPARKARKAYKEHNKEKIRDIEVRIRDIKKRLTENNFNNSFERGLWVKQIDMLEKDIKYYQTGTMSY